MRVEKRPPPPIQANEKAAAPTHVTREVEVEEEATKLTSTLPAVKDELTELVITSPAASTRLCPALAVASFRRAEPENGLHAPSTASSGRRISKSILARGNCSLRGEGEARFAVRRRKRRASNAPASATWRLGLG